MRTVPARLGAAPRLKRGTQSMSEVQKPVLEHAAPETKEERSLAELLREPLQECQRLVGSLLSGKSLLRGL
jgi:hypothetical protein